MSIDTTPAGVDSSEGIDVAEGNRDPRAIWRPSTTGYIGRFFVLGLFALFVVSAPYWVADTSTNVLSRAAVFAIVALSMNVLMGYTGQVSLGHAAFVGVGAFSAGYALTEAQVPWPFAVAFAILTGGISALILGGIALRVKGLYLALVTIAYGLFAQEVIFNIRAVTRGGAGMPSPRPAFAAGDYAFYYLCVGAALLVWVLDWLFTSSKAGRAVQALRDDERVAASWGINVTGYKLLAFVISGSIAGLAGALFGSIEQIVSPISFGFTLSLTFVLMTVIGGLGSRPGVITGGALFAVLPNLLETAHNVWTWWPFGALWEPLIGALLLLLTLIFFPGGIAQQNEHLYRWLSFKPFHEHGHGAVGGPQSGGGGHH
jgi:branched-chain amino acid transport system permease protein